MEPYIKGQYYMITTIPLCDNYFLVVTVRQEILKKGKLDEFDESFVSSIFNSSNFY